MENLTDRVTTKEAARILGVTDGRVRQMILKGQLRASLEIS
jgi:excisionase family DNA binding protein